MTSVNESLDALLDEIQHGIYAVSDGVDDAIANLREVKKELIELESFIENARQNLYEGIRLDKETRDMIVRVIKNRKKSLENDETVVVPILFHKFELADCSDILDILGEE